MGRFGISVALLTPFTPEDGIDTALLAAHAKGAVAAGCHGVTVFGTTGEGASVALGERGAALAALASAGVAPGQTMAGLAASALGDVLAGDIVFSGDADLRARVRGQVVALGPQAIGGRSFDAVVIELFGDVPVGNTSTRLDGAIVVDRGSGLLLRLDLNSAQPRFQLQRRLVRVDPAG